MLRRPRSARSWLAAVLSLVARTRLDTRTREGTHDSADARVSAPGEMRPVHRGTVNNASCSPGTARILSTAISCRKHWSPCCRSTCQYDCAPAPSYARRAGRRPVATARDSPAVLRRLAPTPSITVARRRSKTREGGRSPLPAVARDTRGVSRTIARCFSRPFAFDARWWLPNDVTPRICRAHYQRLILPADARESYYLQILSMEGRDVA